MDLPASLGPLHQCPLLQFRREILPLKDPLPPVELGFEPEVQLFQREHPLLLLVSWQRLCLLSGYQRFHIQDTQESKALTIVIICVSLGHFKGACEA